MLWGMGSRLMGFSSCSVWGQRLWSIGFRCSAACLIFLDGPEVKPVSPALAGRVSSTILPGEASVNFIRGNWLHWFQESHPDRQYPSKDKRTLFQ